MIWLWMGGLLRQRKNRLIGTMVGIALTVALLAALGAFLTQGSASMTKRAITGVPVDWQVQLVPGTSPASIADALPKAAATSQLQTVGYANVDGFEATTGQTVQTTGAGKVLGLDASYSGSFPRQLRILLGSFDGALVAQQTAANLHVSVGDNVTIQRPGLPAAQVKVAGVVDLPNADSLFQLVGVPPGAAPQAPPDNVLLLPLATWHQLFDPQAAVRPDSIRMQLHVGLTHSRLSHDPEAAFTEVQGAAHNLEARIAGSGIVADNLAARLDAVRGDALYARVLFLFLGAPGCLIAVFLTFAVAASGADRRRRDQALLRIRGASRTQIMTLAAVEAALVGLGGAVAGVSLAALASSTLLSTSIFDGQSLVWVISAAVAGLLLAQAAILSTAWRDVKQNTVKAARMTIGTERARLWQRVGLDFICLALAALVFWRTASTGYQVVLAPEGTPSSSVDYQAFLAPLLFWLGIGLLTTRLSLLGLSRGRQRLAQALQPLAGPLAGLAASAISRQRRRITHGIALVVLGFAFAASTAIFNTTYHAQSRADAELTNGADVTVTGTFQAPASAKLNELSHLPGVSAAQAMQHRFAYVGNDLQDLYGINPLHIGQATRMSNAYFQSGDAQQTLARLARTPDGILVSEETVKDFQLQPGDELNLRLQHAQDHQYHSVKFHFIGVVREFPTAPRDSFLVANATYVAQQTGAHGAEIVLLQTTGSPTQLATAARKVAASLPGAKVSDIGQAQHLISSSLTAIDLSGLVRLELGFAVLMVAGATGLILALGLADRRRMFAILSALGAKPRQLGVFLWSEALLLFIAGSTIGTLTGFGLAWMLVKLLTGVFDPPPQFISVPWLYLASLVGVALLSVISAVLATLHETRIAVVRRMREI